MERNSKKKEKSRQPLTNSLLLMTKLTRSSNQRLDTPTARPLLDVDETFYFTKLSATGTLQYRNKLQSYLFFKSWEKKETNLLIGDQQSYRMVPNKSKPNFNWSLTKRG